jgi:hypothetical protein
MLSVTVPLLAGCGWGNFLVGGHATSSVHRATVIAGPASHVPRWIRVEHLPPKAVAGANVFATSGCTTCHTYARSGGSNLGAPDLTAIGRRHLGIRFEIRLLRCPVCVKRGSPMPSFASLGPKRLHQLAVFLEASKGMH